MVGKESEKPAAAETANGLQNIDQLSGSVNQENSQTLASAQAAPVTVAVNQAPANGLSIAETHHA
jgi:hypothetical protein